MSIQPSVDFCLLIPCYNNAAGLARSLSSVSYSAGPYIVLVVDDGSRLPLDAEELKGLVKTGGELVLIRHEKNRGITKALNSGLEWIEANMEARYVARLDCGDICAENRFDLQVGLMDSDPRLGLTASWCTFRDPQTGEQYSYVTPLLHEDIMKELYVRNVFIHPTVMMRSLLLRQSGHYPAGFELVEDYALFWTLAKMGRTQIVDQFLVTCEINRAGISFRNRGKQLAARWIVVKRFGTDRFRQVRGYLQLAALFVTPKELILWLKKRKG